MSVLTEGNPSTSLNKYINFLMIQYPSLLTWPPIGEQDEFCTPSSVLIVIS